MIDEDRQSKAVAPRSLQLTRRQRQILRLMCEGRSNKEIARVLDISLGTVKQHAAALFKRMDVRNRSMAVSQAMGLVGDASPDQRLKPVRKKRAQHQGEESLLVRRPCTVVALRPRRKLDLTQTKHLNGVLAKQSTDANALFVPSEAGGGEVILGIKSVSEWDVLVAALLVQRVRDQLKSFAPGDPCPLSICINSGLAVIAIDGAGRWLGDTVATPVTSTTRKLLSGCTIGQLLIAGSTTGMLRAFHASNLKVGSALLPIERVEATLAIDFKSVPELVARDLDYQRLEAALSLNQTGSLIQLCGVPGSGKTHLCRALFSHRNKIGLPGKYFRSIPGAHVIDANTGLALSLQEFNKELRSIGRDGQALVIVDDADLLDEVGRITLRDIARSASNLRIHFVITAHKDLLGAGQVINLELVSVSDLERMIRSYSMAGERDERGCAKIASDALGIPRFALELALSGGRELSLPILTAVASQIEENRVSWSLLRDVLSSDGTAAWYDEEEVSRAIAASILKGSSVSGSLDFAGPLVRHAVASLAL
jgi:DNA-binding CsgD family transcriptional regulator